MQKIKANVYISHIQHNAKLFKKLTKRKLCAVVKANAYGHGAEEVVNALESTADCFAVALLEEGIAIRTVTCGKDILVLTPPTCEEEILLMAKNGLILTVPDLWTAKRVARLAIEKRLFIRVHLKMNTGMNRYGMHLSMLGKVCKHLYGNPFVQVEGLYTHIYDYTLAQASIQRKTFERMSSVCKRYFPNVIAHLGGTYAALLGEEFAFDMVRVGIGLYGYLPTGMQDVKKQEEFLRANLKKGMKVYAKIVASRAYRYGGVGYGKPLSTSEQKEMQRISVCRVGYADGFLRKRENGLCKAEENANNLCMDVCLRKNNKRRGQWIEIMTDAEETAQQIDSISYEVLCSMPLRAEYQYVYDEKE